jgi:hypothetical protein
LWFLGWCFFFGNFFILIFYFTSWMGLQSEIYQSSSLHFLWVYVTSPALENQSSGRRGARACERREKPRNETQNQSFEFERLSRFIMPCFFFPTFVSNSHNTKSCKLARWLRREAKTKEYPNIQHCM